MENNNSMNILKLQKEGMFFDMHFHTNFSDGSTKVSTVAKICKRNGIGIAITDHNEIKGALIASLEPINLIPGIELRSKENLDILVYFRNIQDCVEYYKKYVKPNLNGILYAGLKLSGVELIEHAKKFNALVSLPHPFAFYHSVRNHVKNLYIEKGKDKFNLIKKFDAIEVMNGHLMKTMNLKAIELAKAYKKGYTAGSDGHVRFDLGGVLNFCYASSIDEYFEEILKKRNKIYYYPGRVPRMIVSKGWCFRKHAKHPIYYMTRMVQFGKRKISKIKEKLNNHT